jgi:hypothetical protein
MRGLGAKLKATLECPVEPVPPAMKALIDRMKEKERKTSGGSGTNKECPRFRPGF